MDAALAAAVLAFVLVHSSKVSVLHWALAAGLMLLLSAALFELGAAVYFLPPVGYTGPITPETSNSFPSHHALLATAIVALVALCRPRWAIPFASLAVLIDWGLVAGHTHHLVDVVGSSVFVAIATLVALLIAPTIARRLASFHPLSTRRNRGR